MTDPLSQPNTAADNDAIPPPKGSPKGAAYWLRRIGIGVAGVIGTVVIIFSGGLAVALALALLSLIGTHEFFRAIRSADKAEPTEWLAYLACVMFQVIAMLKSGGLDEFREAVIALIIVTTLLSELVKPRRTPVENIGATLIGALYVGWLISFFTLIRVGNYPFIHSPILHPHFVIDHEAGAWMMVLVVAATFAGDTGALFTGYLFGRNKMAPAISPAKTWEGAAGGIVWATAFTLAAGHWIGVPLVHSAALGVLIGSLGLLGDLCESALKRELGVKDFGRFFGNHGGVLDRCDSLLFTGPVAYYYMLLLLHR